MIVSCARCPSAVSRPRPPPLSARASMPLVRQRREFRVDSGWWVDRVRIDAEFDEATRAEAGVTRRLPGLVVGEGARRRRMVEPGGEGFGHAGLAQQLHAGGIG